jgi:integrase
LLDSYLSKKAVRSVKTMRTYRGALMVWTRSRNIPHPDQAVQKIKDDKLDPYQILQDFVIHLQKQGRAPKTIGAYIGALKGFLIDSDVEVSGEKFKQKVVLPQRYEVSTDRAPTKEEMKSLLLRSKLATKTAIAILASSGMRLGELSQLKLENISLGERGQPSKILIHSVRGTSLFKPSTTKSRRRRLTFITTEATDLLREYLGEKISKPETVLFPEGTDALYGRIINALQRTGLRRKSDSDSKRFELHPHCFRKYFFSNCLSAGIDRGLVESFMGHAFALDSNYLRMSDEELAKQYQKAADRLTFLTTTTGITDEQLSSTLQERDARIERLERELAQVSTFLQLAANPPVEPKKKEGVTIAWDPRSHGLKWPLPSKREKGKTGKA